MTTDPAWLVRARAELGVRETPGPVSTKRVLEYRQLAGMPLGGDDGVVPWCSIFVAAMLREAGVDTAGANAMARSWLKWGVPITDPLPGAIVVLKSSLRPAPSGHVTIATGRVTRTMVEGCGGNQGDAVSIALFSRANILGCRWPAHMPLPVGAPLLISSASPTHPVRDV